MASLIRLNHYWSGPTGEINTQEGKQINYVMLCKTLSDSNCLKICEKAVGICILADLHLRFAGGNYQHL